MVKRPDIPSDGRDGEGVTPWQKPGSYCAPNKQQRNIVNSERDLLLIAFGAALSRSERARVLELIPDGITHSDVGHVLSDMKTGNLDDAKKFLTSRGVNVFSGCDVIAEVAKALHPVADRERARALMIQLSYAAHVEDDASIARRLDEIQTLLPTREKKVKT